MPATLVVFGPMKPWYAPPLPSRNVTSVRTVEVLPVFGSVYCVYCVGKALVPLTLK
jgi:hypothetical protein